jgi:quinol-cytochrome oxidoreductase complex cytochrome b subunit
MVPFLNKGAARRPVEQPFWAAVGVVGVVLSITLAALAIQNFFPISLDLLITLTFMLPLVGGILTYAVLKTMREGYMYDLNRRYYMLRPPK